MLAQVALYAQPDCRCGKNFDALVDKVQLNYAGFTDKTTGRQQLAYNRLRDSLRARADQAQGNDCFGLLAAYTLFFNDRHLQLGNYAVSKLPKIYVPLTLTQAKQQTRQARPDELPGVWRSEDGKTQLAILHQPSNRNDGFDFQGIVLSSQDTTLRPGLELFRAKRTNQSYYVKSVLDGLYNHPYPTKQHGNIFYAKWTLTLVREFPFQPSTSEQQELAANHVLNGFSVRPLANQVALISLRRGFSLSSQVMDSVLRAHEPLLSQSPNLIIDLRDNGGGNNTWENLLPYVYAKPVEWPGGWRIRSSPDNVRTVEADTVYGGAEQRAKDRVLIEQLRRHPGQLVSSGDQSITIKLDSVRANPRRVVVLVNDRCASSTEYITQIAKQSPGVTVMGSPTAGTMDYGDLRRPTPLPCPDLKLTIPIAKSPWTDTAPIDPTGILPDISLTSEPEAQWLDIAVKKLQSGTLPAKP